MSEIKSNNTYLARKLNEINSISEIGKSISVSASSYASSTSVPTGEPSIVQAVLNSAIDVCTKISCELQSIGIVGDRFVNMDNFLKDETLTLGFEVLSSMNEISNYIPVAKNSIDEIMNMDVPAIPVSEPLISPKEDIDKLPDVEEQNSSNDEKPENSDNDNLTTNDVFDETEDENNTPEPTEYLEESDDKNNQETNNKNEIINENNLNNKKEEIGNQTINKNTFKSSTQKENTNDLNNKNQDEENNLQNDNSINQNNVFDDNINSYIISDSENNIYNHFDIEPVINDIINIDDNGVLANQSTIVDNDNRVARDVLLGVGSAADIGLGALGAEKYISSKNNENDESYEVSE